MYLKIFYEKAICCSTDVCIGELRHLPGRVDTAFDRTGHVMRRELR